MSVNEQIKNAVAGLVIDFIIEHRVHDMDLPLGSIDEALIKGEITLDEIGSTFKRNICYTMGCADEAEFEERIKDGSL